jgi:hypothetical protein
MWAYMELGCCTLVAPFGTLQESGKMEQMDLLHCTSLAARGHHLERNSTCRHPLSVEQEYKNQKVGINNINKMLEIQGHWHHR